MDAKIAEGMTRAKEKDERSLGLFNQLLERRGPNVRIWSCQQAFIHVDSVIVQETSTSPNANARIRMEHTDQRVHTKAQVREGLSFLLFVVSSMTRSHLPIPWLLPPGRPTHLPRPR